MDLHVYKLLHVIEETVLFIIVVVSEGKVLLLALVCLRMVHLARVVVE